MKKTARQELLSQFIQSYQRTGQLVFKCIHAALQGHSHYNPACLMVLKVLREKGPLSQHAIATTLYHSDAAVSRQIGVLSEKGYVSADVDSANRRITTVSLTEEGRKVLAVAEAAVASHMARLLESVPDEHLTRLTEINKELQDIVIANQEKDTYEQ